MTRFKLLSVSLLAIFLASCAGVDMPKGNSKGYSSARLVKPGPNVSNIDIDERQLHGMIHGALAQEFKSKGMAYGGSNADLVVAYLVLYQKPGMTAQYDDYFGYGRNAMEITDLAHTKGALEGGSPDFFERGGIVIDVLDAKTNELVYRDYASADILHGISDATRRQRIRNGVSEALADFFK